MFRDARTTGPEGHWVIQAKRIVPFESPESDEDDVYHKPKVPAPPVPPEKPPMPPPPCLVNELPGAEKPEIQIVRHGRRGGQPQVVSPSLQAAERVRARYEQVKRNVEAKIDAI